MDKTNPIPEGWYWRHIVGMDDAECLIAVPPRNEALMNLVGSVGLERIIESHKELEAITRLLQRVMGR